MATAPRSDSGKRLNRMLDKAVERRNEIPPRHRMLSTGSRTDSSERKSGTASKGR
jgi:hypothetical protein